MAPAPMVYYVLVDVATGKILISGYCPSSDLEHQAGDGQIAVQLTAEQVGINGKSFRYDVENQQFVQVLTDLQQAQASLITRLKMHCGQVIVGGFTSSALGSPHNYPSTMTDQSNMLRASLTGGDLWCAVSNVWAMQAHTVDQAKTALGDFGAMCDAARSHLNDLTDQANAATTLEQLGAIAW